MNLLKSTALLHNMLSALIHLSLFEIENKKIFNAGDTCLNSELKLIGELYQPDIAILPIGGHYTMDIQDATIAAQWLRASLIIPMHYNTFSLIKVDENEFCRLIEKNGHTYLLHSNFSDMIMRIIKLIENTNYFFKKFK